MTATSEPAGHDDEAFALTATGRVLHLVDGEHDDTSIIGKPARCGRKVRRLCHPSDHYNGAATVCRNCGKEGNQPR